MVRFIFRNPGLQDSTLGKASGGELCSPTRYPPSRSGPFWTSHNAQSVFQTLNFDISSYLELQTRIAGLKRCRVNNIHRSKACCLRKPNPADDLPDACACGPFRHAGGRYSGVPPNPGVHPVPSPSQVGGSGSRQARTIGHDPPMLR